MESLLVHSAQGDYRVHFQDSLPRVMTSLLETPPSAAVIDSRVAALYHDQLAPLLSAVPCLLLEATEENKTLGGIEQCTSFLQSHACSRKSILLAIGGGIIQDICSLSAHIYHRGIRWNFLPTTLLSMSDSCIGAKCGVNLGAFKNQLGAFHAPGDITICSEFLGTLEDREVASGYGEILKLMLIGGEAPFKDLAEAVTGGGLRNERLLELIRASLDIKRAIIEVDEFDLGLRQILNYGHTFGHALEMVTNHAIPHGLAVAWGIDVVNHIAERRGLLSPDHCRAISGFVREYLAPESTEGLHADALLEGVKRDKKASSGSITLAILREPGRAERVATAIDERLKADLEDYLTHHNVLRPPSRS